MTDPLRHLPDALQRAALKLLPGSRLPAHWLYLQPPARASRAARKGPLHVEIVSHCWQYSRLLAYQLSSLVLHPVHDLHVTMTVFHGRDDASTVALLDWFADRQPQNVTWNWCELPPEQLFRRAIGRNQAALASRADWVWFTDCDLTFQAGCLDALNALLQGRQDALVYPETEAKTDVYTDDDAVQSNILDKPALLSLPDELWHEWPVTRATGPLQITHGDVARAVGYCNGVSFYQIPRQHWQKATEDRLFRWLLGTQGVPIALPGVCRVQHADKGRYQSGTASAGWRQRVRRWQQQRRVAQRR